MKPKGRIRYFRITVQYKLQNSDKDYYTSFMSNEYLYPLDEDIIKFVAEKIPGSHSHYVLMVAELSRFDFQRYKGSREKDKPKIITKQSSAKSHLPDSALLR